MKRAFTLVEILVCIGIIAVLSAVIYPSFAASRTKAKGATCLSNLSQIGKGVLMYAADNDDAIPLALSSDHAKDVTAGKDIFQTDALNEAAKYAPDIRVALQPYGTVAQTWFCPMDHISPSLRADGVKYDTFFEDSGSSYGYDDRHALQPWYLYRYKKSAESLIAWEIESFHSTYGPSGFIQVVFADGHAKAITNEVRSKYIYNDYFDNLQ